MQKFSATNSSNTYSKKRKSRSLADARLITNYLGSFKAKLILGNVQRLLNKDLLFSIKESKWNFITDLEQVSSLLQLEKEKKLKKEDVQANVINEMCKNNCNQDVVISLGNQSSKQYCLLRHKFCELWRFPIYCNFIELRIEVCSYEDEVRNVFYDHINTSMIDQDEIGQQSQIDLTIGNQQKLNNYDILAVNKFRQVMASIKGNAVTTECIVHISLKQQFFTFPLNISKVIMQKGCSNFVELSLNEQLELLGKDSLYILFDLLKIPKINNLDIPLSKKAPFISKLYKLKMNKNMLNDNRKAILLFEEHQCNDNNESKEINQLIDIRYLRSVDNLDQNSVRIDKNSMEQVLDSQSGNDNVGQHDEEEEDDNEELQDYDDSEEDQLIYQNQEQDGDTAQEGEERNNIEEGKNFTKTQTPNQMLKSFELKEYQKQGLTWMLFREQKIKRKKLYEKKQFVINNSDGSYGDISQAYIQYQINQLNDTPISFYYNPLNGHSCLDIEVEEEKNPIRGGILADQMGLGKTIMTISLILQSKFKDYLNEDFGSGGTGGGGSSSSFNALNNVSRYANNTQKFYLNTLMNSIQEKSAATDPNNNNNTNNANRQITLIVVPKSLVRQWEKEIKSTLKQEQMLQIHLYEKSQPYYDVKPIFKDKDIVITTYGILASEFKNIKKGKVQKGYLMNQKWERVILDEAHIIRNRNTLVSLACCELKTKFRWCLTGTPLQNKLDDLYSYFKFLEVPQVSDWRWWKNFISNNKQKEKTYQFVKAVLKGVMLRRTKTTKDQDGKLILVLPKKLILLEQIPFNKFEGELYTVYFSNQKKLFENVLQNYEKQKELRGQLQEKIFVMINSLRMMCNNFQMVKIFQESSLKKLRSVIKQLKAVEDARDKNTPWEIALNKRDNTNDQTEEQVKLLDSQNQNKANLDEDSDESDSEESYLRLAKTERVVDIISQVSQRNEKAVVFTQWHDSISRFKDIFQAKGISFCELHGRMSIKDRAQQVNDFYKIKTKTVMILSLMAGCVGLNLTCANNVIMMDPWWNSSIEEQAIDRIYRIGQKKDINVYRCLINHPNSIDLRIDQLHKQKQQIFNNVMSISSDERSIQQNLSIEDYKFIFGMNSLPSTELEQQQPNNNNNNNNVNQVSNNQSDINAQQINQINNIDQIRNISAMIQNEQNQSDIQQSEIQKSVISFSEQKESDEQDTIVDSHNGKQEKLYMKTIQEDDEDRTPLKPRKLIGKKDQQINQRKMMLDEDDEEDELNKFDEFFERSSYKKKQSKAISNQKIVNKQSLSQSLQSSTIKEQVNLDEYVNKSDNNLG